MKNEQLLLGAHLSIAKGLDYAIAEGQKIGCTAIQFFSKSNRQWQAKPLTQNQVAQFKQARENSTIKQVIIHACYLINIGSSDSKIATLSVNALCDELERADVLQAEALVLHPGSHKNNSPEQCLDNIINNINLALNKVNTSKTKLLLETMAGQGSSVGHTFEQLAYIYQHIARKNKVGICLDTCHMFAAGYDITTHAGYQEVMTKIEKLIGLENIGAIHINDSKKTLGSRIDRHEHIGKGCIGLNGFSYIIHDPRLTPVPKILETPLDHPDDHARNIQVIKELMCK